MTDGDVAGEFPAEHLLPRRETQALSFMTREPRYDGRGVLVAILDTGVDPAAPGLQVTSTGEAKLVDMYDMTGAGDVDTSTVVSVSPGGAVTGLSGRQLRIPASWQIANDRVHLGLKSAAELFPRMLADRLSSEWKACNWDEMQRQAQIEAAQRSESVSTESQCAGTLTERWIREEAQAGTDSLKEIERQKRLFGGEFAALGAFDCLVFQDAESKTWKACVDTSLSGELDNLPVLGNFRECRQWAQFGKVDRLTYTVNVYDEGNLLEIVANCGAHATHVAAICAAHFSADEAAAPSGAADRDSVAPGAQLVSFKIGDTRLGSMETGQALLRAISKAVELRCDMINYSYGEAAHLPNYGRICEAIDDAVNKHRILFVSSAGNNGPALSTLGAPGGTSEAAIGVGAVVHAPTTLAAYSALCPPDNEYRFPPNACIPFTWTSRGPTTDGYNGPSICAPGAAVTSVPNWCLRGSQLMNGTSMASPNACGAIALLLSALKQNSMAYSPQHVRHAIEYTARMPASSHLSDPFALGNGLIQVEQAWQWLTTHHYEGRRKFYFSVQCSAPTVTPACVGGHSAPALDGGADPDAPLWANGNAAHSLRGIYLRELSQCRVAHDFTVTVEPRFVKEDVSNDELIALDLHLVAVCDESWVQVPRFLYLLNGSRSFHVLVDPRSLPPGTHCTEIRVYEAAKSAQSADWLFKVPVTVLVPECLSDSGTRSWTGLRLRPAELHRLFVHVPRGATFVQVRVETHENERDGESKGDANAARLLLHAVQLRSLGAFRVHEYHKHSAVSLHTFRVTDERTLELCVARWWAELGTIFANISVAFRGLEPKGVSTGVSGSFVMLHTEGPLRVDLSTRLVAEACQPNVVIRSLVQSLRPTNYAIRTLPAYRDRLYDGRRALALELTYSFNLQKLTDVEPNFAPLSDLLYESDFDAQFWMIFDANKQLLASGDAFSDRYSTKLEKGAYTLKLRVRHDRRELLERFKDTPLLLSQRLAPALAPTFDFYELPQHCTTNGRKLPVRTLAPGQNLSVFIGSLSEEKLAKLPSSPPGSFLEGCIGFVKERDRDAVANSSPQSPRDAFPFKYVLAERAESAANAAKKPEGGKKAQHKSSEKRASSPSDAEQSPVCAPSDSSDTAADTELADALRDAKISLLTQRCSALSERVGSQTGLQIASEFARVAAFYQELATAHNDHMPLHSGYLEELHSLKEALLVRVGIVQLQFSETIDSSLRDNAAMRSDLQALSSLLEDVQRVANVVVSRIDPLALAAYFGVKADARGAKTAAGSKDVFTSSKAEMERTRSQLVDALVRLGLAQADSLLLSRFASINEDTLAELKLTSTVEKSQLDKTISDLFLWCEPSDAKLAELTIRHALVHEHLARACKQLLQSVQEDVQNKKKSQKKSKSRMLYESTDPVLASQARIPTNEARLLRTLRRLGWTHCAVALERTYPVRYPHSYTLF